MAFWGVEVKAGKPFTLKATESTGTRRLHLSQATSGIGNATNRSIVQCNVGNKSPLYLCILSPDKVESCQLNLEFEEADDVIFSVIGPRSVHLTGYFLGRSTAFRPNDDESESYGEDIADTDVEKGSSDDYDYSDSFINDADPSARGSHLSSTDDDDEISIKEMAAKTKDKKKKGKGGRLRKRYVVVDSDSDETSARADDSSNGDSVQVLENDNDQKKAKVLSSECPLPSRVTRSKARSSTLENVEPDAECEKTSEARTNTDKTLDERREDHPAGDVNLSPLEKGSEVLSKKKKKKKKRDRSEETADVEKNNSECPKRKKQAIDKNIEKEAGTNKPLESEISSNEVVVEDIEKGNLDGKAAVKGKRVSIHYTAKLKDTGKVFESNLVEAPLRFRLGGDKVIEGLSIGVEGMRVGDKRRLTIPPSLGFSEERLKEGVPKDAWLVYEVERVKIK